MNKKTLSGLQHGKNANRTQKEQKLQNSAVSSQKESTAGEPVG